MDQVERRTRLLTMHASAHGDNTMLRAGSKISVVDMVLKDFEAMLWS